AAGVEEPLLPARNIDKAPAKESPYLIPGAVFNVSTSIIGAGIMSIPATFKVLGVIPAFVMIVLIALVVDISVEFILRFTYAGDSRTYAAVMRESFGAVGSVGVQICVMVTNLGCLVMYLIIIGDVLSGKGADHLGVLQEWFGIQWWNLRAVALLFIVLFVMLPLLLFRRIESLWFSSAISVFLAIVFVVICSGLAISALLRNQIKPPRFLPHLENSASFFNLFTAIPVIVTAYTFHFNVHAITVEMGSPSKMIHATKIALLLCGAIYFAVGIFGYLLFGDSTMDDILVNFDQGTGPSSGVSALMDDLVRLSYALHLVLVFPLLNFSLRSNIDEFLFPTNAAAVPLASDARRFVILTVVLLAVAYGLAIVIPSIWYLFQFMGSTSAVSLSFIFPGALVLRDIHGISTAKDKAVGAAMVVIAVFTSVTAISTNVY
ncbi:amino acid transporter, partial [Genlisea aurea]